MTPMHAAPQDPPAPPTPPTPPTPPGAAAQPVVAGQPGQVFTTEQLARPMTRAEVEALQARRTELSNQLRSVETRREEIVREIRRSPEGAARQGLEERLKVLDARLVQLESDIASSGRLLTAAPGGALAGSAVADVRDLRDGGAGPFSSGQLTAISIVFTLFVMAPLAMAAARSLLRRSAQPKPTPQILESTARLERMEQAVDAIAVEIERISEGQRFVTQLLARRTEQGALGEGQREPLRDAQRPEPVRVGGQ